MDQVKAFLSQVVRYRFWISICVAVLFSAGAYVLGSGPVQKAAEDEKNKIESAYKDVQQYASSAVPTADFAPIVQAKTEVLNKDVDAAWEALYERQAPLLTWPETVAERFTKWGRKWPEDVAGTAVQLAIIDYIEAYPEYVDSVFKVFRPFDYETGEGVVASAPRDQLLQVVAFDINKLPKLNEVWSAQERLWVQRTVLEVIADVNRDARDWDTASVKEIKVLEVGSAVAQDQRSLAKGEELEEAEPIVNPDEPEEEFEEGGMGGMGGMGSEGMMAMMGSGGMAKGGRGPGMGGMGGKIETAESVFYLKPENATQYKILPVMVTVLVDQERVPDLLVAFENSPMSIEVRDFELQRTTDPVVKPEKGDEFSGYGMMGMGMMGPGMMGGRRGYGGMMGRMMGEMGGAEGMSMMGPGMMGSGMMGPGMMRGMGGMGGMAQARKGVDRRGVDRAEKRKEAEKAITEAKSVEPSPDLYYNIVEVTVYGQARFYNEPTPEAAEEASPGEADADAESDAMTTEQPEAEEPKAEAPVEQPAAAPEAPEADEAQAAPAEEPKAEAAPVEEPKAEGTAPAEEPKAEEAAPAEADAPQQGQP
ncbi:hypothetical protein [Paludisphaera sp.]|uniref:hypothetical protein n=1 Tax=Paludisphaera sp. TaxID=2017432 RepID=UPI00301DCB69